MMIGDRLCRLLPGIYDCMRVGLPIFEGALFEVANIAQPRINMIRIFGTRAQRSSHTTT